MASFALHCGRRKARAALTCVVAAAALALLALQLRLNVQVSSAENETCIFATCRPSFDKLPSALKEVEAEQ